MKAAAVAVNKAQEVSKAVASDTAAKTAPKRARRSKRSNAGVKAMHEDFTVPVFQR